MAIFNSIIPGSAWAQPFSFPAGAIDYAGGETLRARFRLNSASPIIFTLDEPGSIVRSGNDYTIGLDAIQTFALAGSSRIAFDLYAVKLAVTRALGVRVHVPVVEGL